ncbi:hypothetical protein CEXT_215801 [Caerostris extrusa]|uniref:Uncharacterized protein n=1 Tax=Caerostris extrusa TaxID=172846 RepID=A0AAV4MMH3_CAEEX|nr:hypothetical protein CEXT_215801 [Caerostris extrusa]
MLAHNVFQEQESNLRWQQRVRSPPLLIAPLHFSTEGVVFPEHLDTPRLRTTRRATSLDRIYYRLLRGSPLLQAGIEPAITTVSQITSSPTSHRYISQ